MKMLQNARKVISLLMAFCLIATGGLSMIALAEEPQDASAETVIGDAALKDYSLPSDSKHAYDPFGDLASEEETKAYRESVQYESNTIIYKVTETKPLFSDYKEQADAGALTEAGIDLSSATELTRKKVEDGLWTDTYEVIYQADLDGEVWDAVDALAETEGVVDAQPNYLYEDTAIDVPTVSKNPHMDKQWHHGKDHLNCDKHWQHMHDEEITAGEGAIVAVIDTGVDYTHPDLAANMWINTAEKNGTPGVDDDGNGYIDDIHGVSTLGATRYHTGDPMDDHGHGTHVAGIIAMTANNDEGAVGLAYGAKIMAIKAGQATGIFSDTDIAEAINYAKAMGADVINMSFGGTGKSFLVEEALADAFGSCVLVAAAGNDGIPTADAPDDFMKKADFYPAGYSFVLGVMASDQNGNLASFSNWDYYSNGGSAEYEMTAPGVDIYSTLPDGQYAPWDGTSMAAPLVSAAAALIRSKFSDKQAFSSRFIMGQLASATDKSLTYVDKTQKAHFYTMLDLEASLNQLPEPNLIVKNLYLFDDPAIDPANDGDGIIDAGETIDLGLVVRNQWGMAGNVTVTVDALSTSGIANPNIEWITDTISMEDIGTFNEQTNGFLYDNDALVGASNPIRFKVKEDTINDAHIGLNITVTCTNALDETDTTLYTEEDGTSFYVQRGKTISGKLTEDLTMTPDHYWIIDNSLWIPEGVTVKVEPGTQIQFWGSDGADPYAAQPIVYIQVDGTFLVEGTEEAPVEMFPSAAYANYGVEIFDGERGTYDPSFKDDAGLVSLQYAEILNPLLELDQGDHLSVIQNCTTISRLELDFNDGSLDNNSQGGKVLVRDLRNSKIEGLRSNYLNGYFSAKIGGSFNQVLLNNCVNLMTKKSYGTLEADQDTVFLNNRNASIFQVGDYFTEEQVEFSEIFTYGDKKYVVGTFETPMPDGSNSLNYYNYYALSAVARGGTLACLNSAEETAAVVEFLRENETGKYVHLGMTADQNTGTLSWADGDNSYFPDKARAYSYYEISKYCYYYHPDGYIEATATSYALSTTESDYNKALFEYPATVSDETILTPLTPEQYYSVAETGVTNSAILNPMLTQNADTWFKVATDIYNERHYNGVKNYWGTTNEKLIQAQITDAQTYVNYADLLTDPYLTLESPELETIYPFVTDAYITDLEGNRIESCGYEEIQFHVTFNRDMDPSILPMVSFGPAEPYTDYVVDGAFIDARHWVGTTKVKSIIDSGTEYIRIKDAAAAEDSWLTTGTDTGRFAFTIANTGAEALTMQAVGGENQVELSWTQDDYDTLAGFNVYRSTKADSGFTKINERLLPGTIREFVDTNVEPGVEYFYYFTVMGTDLVESNPSNTANATPIDNIQPILTHNRVTAANFGEMIALNATASDNIGLEYIRLFYRAKGAENWIKVDMTNISGNDYYASIAAKDVSAAGMEYYIEISDGVTAVREGSASYPISIAVDDSIVIYSVSPAKLDVAAAAEGVTAILTGVNFREGMTLKVGGKEVAYTLVSDTRLSFTVPAATIGRVDITLTCEGETVMLNNAITYTDSTTEAQIIAPDEVKCKEITKLPVIIGSAGEVSALDLQFKLERNLYSAISFELSEKNTDATARCSSTSAGVVKVSVATAGTLNLSEPVGYLVLTPKGATEAATTTVQITSAKLNDVPAASLFHCNMVIKPNFTISGKITYYNGNATLEGVKVTLSTGQTAYTDATGTYTITGITTNKVTVIPSHTGNVNGAITAQDAAELLQYIVDETATLTNAQITAADVNGDGEATALDAVYILRKNVGIITDAYPGSGAEWAFDAPSRVLTLTDNVSNINFSGILLGDVTGNWTAKAEGGLS